VSVTVTDTNPPRVVVTPDPPPRLQVTRQDPPRVVVQGIGTQGPAGPPGSGAGIDISALGAVPDDTTNNAAPIQAALNQAAAAGGGTVHVPPGVWRTGPLTIGSRVRLVGDGFHSILRAMPSATADLITTASTSVDLFQVADLTLDCWLQSPGSGAAGLRITSNASGYSSGYQDAHHSLRDLLVIGTAGPGVAIGSGGREIRMHNVVVRDPRAGHGFDIQGTDNFFSMCTAATTRTPYHGFYVHNSNNRLVGCKAFYCGNLNELSNGFFTDRSRCSFVGCEAQDCGNWGFLFSAGSDHCASAGLVADSCGKGGIRVDNSGGAVVGVSMTGFTSFSRSGGRFAQPTGLQLTGDQPGSTFIGACRDNTTKDVDAAAISTGTILVTGTTGDTGARIQAPTLAVNGSPVAGSAHTHTEANVTNLVTDLAGKAASVHTHAEGDVTNLVTDLAAKATPAYVQSRSGGDLFTNGTGLLGSNYNLSALTFDPTDRPIGGGAFITTLGLLQTVLSDELMPVDLSRTYRLRLQAKQKGSDTAGFMFAGLAPLDITGTAVNPAYYMTRLGTNGLTTRTTLAAALNPGATTVQLTNCGNWNNAVGGNTWDRKFIFWDFVDTSGFAWPVDTFSRNIWPTSGFDAGWNDGAINTGTNTITLNQAYTGPVKPAGTPVSQGSAGGSFMYVAASSVAPPQAWTTYQGFVAGQHTNQQAAAQTAFPPGTAFVKLLLIVNCTSSAAAGVATSRQSFSSISFTDVSAPSNRGAAAPTAGKWYAGDIVWNTLPSPTAYAGWVCTAAGTPGTWKGFGQIQA
jgi:hypothetical protein